MSILSTDSRLRLRRLLTVPLQQRPEAGMVVKVIEAGVEVQSRATPTLLIEPILKALQGGLILTRHEIEPYHQPLDPR